MSKTFLLRETNKQETAEKAGDRDLESDAQTLLGAGRLARDCLADLGTASHLCGGLIFAPAPSPGPTSCSNNGCQVESGPDRIELSAPCCVLIYCLRHFHIGFIFTHSTAAAQSSQSLPGRVAPGCGYLAPGNGFLHSRAQVRPSKGAAARPELGIGRHPSNMRRCDTDARTGPFRQQERKL